MQTVSLRRAIKMIRVMAFLILAMLTFKVVAHELRTAVATVSVSDTGIITLVWEINLEAWLVGIDPMLADTDESPYADRYDELRILPPEVIIDRSRARWRELANTVEIYAEDRRVEMVVTQIKMESDIEPELPRIATISLVGGLHDGAKVFSYSVHKSHTNTAVRLMWDGKPSDVQFVRIGETSANFPLKKNIKRSLIKIILDYIKLGFTHIIPKGLDHIAFILGLTLISKRTIDLIIQVTAFTIAHSITLVMGIYGLVSFPAVVVESLIAASIVYIAIENIWRQSVHRSRVVIVFLFGLLHGLGFAGVLTQLGLPMRDFFIGLLSFNVGVELGQLVVILAAYLFVGIWTRNTCWYRSAVVIPSSLVIGFFGLYWFIERIFL